MSDLVSKVHAMRRAQQVLAVAVTIVIVGTAGLAVTMAREKSDVDARLEQVATALETANQRLENAGEQPVPVPSEAGPQGEAGEQGSTGTTGATGAPGMPGLPGRPGKRGPRGFTGLDGATGATGEPGPRGLSCVEQLSLEQCKGPKGEPGQDGKGATGADGAAGPPGPVCPDGYRSEPRDIVTTGTPTGETALVCVPN